MSTGTSAWVPAAEALVRRVLGDRAGDVEVISREPTGRPGESFDVEARGGKVRLGGAGGVAIGSALRHYLVEACGVHVTWDSGALRLPEQFPDHGPVALTSPWDHRYYLNFCTFAYSTPYWDWERWEKEIDWMAMHGITMPLNVIGFEHVWFTVLRNRGMSSLAARRFLGAPSTLPFTWMGVIHHNGEALTEEWIEEHRVLGRRTLERQRELGMRPVRPGFGGYVPAEIAGSEVDLVDWLGFENALLRPEDPLFREIGLEILDVQRREFGTDLLYAIDPFIEGIPPRGDTESVAAFAEVISTTLDEHDPRSVWVLMGWPFWLLSDFWTRERLEAYLGAIDRDRSLVLDFWAEYVPMWEKTEGFVGRRWLWSMLHSLGGRPGMHGTLERLATAPSDAAGSAYGSSLVGLGLGTESLDRDPVLYELAADVTWRGRVDDLDAWVERYARVRTGLDDDRVRRAWSLLASTVYARPELSGPPASIVLDRPSLAGDLRPTVGIGSFSDPAVTRGDLDRLVEAWNLLVDAALDGGGTDGLGRDIVELGRDVLSVLARDEFESALAAWVAKDLDAFRACADRFLALLADIDRLAATRRDMLLGTWVAEAEAWARDEQQRRDYAVDARRLVTTWTVPGTRLEDYAGRCWSGLVSGYYMPRWRLWVDAMVSLLESGEEPDATAFEESVCAFEDEWIRSDQIHPTEPVGVTARVADGVRSRLGLG